LPAHPIHILAEVTGSRILDTWPEEQIVTRLLFDSRKLTIPQGTLFIAIPGRNNDGHRFVHDLYNRGVRHFLVSRNIELPGPANVLLVLDTIKALQDMAAYHRRQLQAPILGITGSNGKTIVKEWLYECLSEDYIIGRSPKSFNSQIGVPLSIWQIEPYHNLGLIEAGISQPGEMQKLQEVIRPNIGLFTNIGSAHGEKFKNTAEKVREKLRLFHDAETLIYCNDQSALAEVIQEDLPTNVKHFTWGWKGRDILIRELHAEDLQTCITLEFKQDVFTIRIPFRDEASIENALHTCAVMLWLGIAPDRVAMRLSSLHPLEMRLEMKEAIHQCALINDSYSADLVSFAIALDFLQQQDKRREHMVILSEILQSDLPDHALYQEVARQLKGKDIRHFAGIGSRYNEFKDLFPEGSLFFESTEDFLLRFPFSELRDRVILLKGARAFGFERIAARLQLKVHETALLINLQSIAHNLNYYRSIINPATRIMAMVKAFGYGSGSWEIAGAMQFHRVDYLAVAYVDEGVTLRQSGIDLPIMVMNPNRDSLETMLAWQLEPEIYNQGLLDSLTGMMHLRNNPEHHVAIHLKIDTGMHRLGFLPEEIHAVAEHLSREPGIRVASVFTHLAASEDPQEDTFTHLQASRFVNACDVLQSALPYPFLRHVLNTAGISRFPQYHFDMVRPGIGLYGFSPAPADQAHLENVMTLRSIISQIKSLEPGDTVGYNRKWTALRPSRVAVIPIGYADGIDRSLGLERGQVLISGQRAPIIGHVCMDMIMVDITDIKAGEGDEVILFGEGLSIEEMARARGTIPYEILTGISARVKRIYYNE